MLVVASIPLWILALLFFVMGLSAIPAAVKKDDAHECVSIFVVGVAFLLMAAGIAYGAAMMVS